MRVDQTLVSPAISSPANGTGWLEKRTRNLLAHQRIGRDRSCHQVEPLPGANGFDLLEHQTQAAGLAVADCQHDEPEQEPQRKECLVFHRSFSLLGQDPLRLARGEWTLEGTCDTDR